MELVSKAAPKWLEGSRDCPSRRQIVIPSRELHLARQEAELSEANDCFVGIRVSHGSRCYPGSRYEAAIARPYGGVRGSTGALMPCRAKYRELIFFHGVTMLACGFRAAAAP